jgi:hypothetical protein
MVEVTCPKCNAPTTYVAELAGREVFCLGCGSHFVIPRLDIEPPGAPNQPHPMKPIQLDVVFPVERPKPAAEADPNGTPTEGFQ